MLVMGVTLYELSATFSNTANTTTSAPNAIGQGAQQAQPGPSEQSRAAIRWV
jgi:hypothetical protein